MWMPKVLYTHMCILRVTFPVSTVWSMSMYSAYLACMHTEYIDTCVCVSLGAITLTSLGMHIVSAGVCVNGRCLCIDTSKGSVLSTIDACTLYLVLPAISNGSSTSLHQWQGRSGGIWRHWQPKVANCRLEWLGHLARMPDDCIPKQPLFGWLHQPRLPRRQSRWRALFR